MLELREYQQRSLEALTGYLRHASAQGARVPFVLMTGRPYRDVPHMTGLDGLPYVCLRVPTGGGKTLMACHALGIATKEYLQADRSVCLWLAPSNAIVKQTLDALKDRRHPYRQAVDAAFAGASGGVRVMDLKESLYVTKGDLDGATCIVVTTLQSLRVDDTEGRKVYETAGALQHHFDGIHPMMRDALETEGEGQIVYSLANVLRMRRPIVIMDEAHNARTPLSFETLARFYPSCIVEFTATPETAHNPERNLFASNVLHHVSALELKEAEMVKLPVKLRTRGDWREIVGDALQTQRSLEKLALEEQGETGEYIRPIVLFQAQSVKGDDINVEALKQSLIDDFKVPEDQIAIATGSTKEIQDVDLFDPRCPIRHIITVRALVEGWDCSFAYILCSVSEISTPRSVEQVLGRILRMPHAKKNRRDLLNCAYAFAASDNFITTAKTLRDALVDGAGFQRMEAGDLVVPDEQRQEQFWGAGTLFAGASERVTEAPNFAQINDERVRREIESRVTFDEASGTISVTGVVTEQEMSALRDCFANPQDQQTVERIYQQTQGRHVGPAERETPGPITVPMLAIRIDGQLELFDESHFLDVPWNLAECDASLSEREFPSESTVGLAGDIDVTDEGQVEMTNFVRELHEQLTMIAVEPGWTVPALANWIDHKVPHPDIPRSQSSLFIHNALTGLMDSRGLDLEQLARQKFRLAKAVEKKIHGHRAEQRVKAYQTMLYGSEPADMVVDPDIALTFDEDRYAPNWFYEGGYRFSKHLFRMIGELKSEGEEFECAVFLDQMDEVQAWVRNLERRERSSFWMQTSTDRFYPDFVALLKDGRILVAEYKGADRWSNDDSKEKRAVGELWAERSGGKCLFVMPNGKDWEAIASIV